MKTIKLSEGKERSLLRRHPWVFQGSIAKGHADAGETVRVESHTGEFLAWSSFSPSSMIRARVWTFVEGERVDHAFFKRRIQAALDFRARLPIRSAGVRLVHGEADGLPGLIVDRYTSCCAPSFSLPARSAGSRRLPTFCLSGPACSSYTSARIRACAHWRACSRFQAGCGVAKVRPPLQPRS